MRNRILSVAVLCAATTLLVACPRSTQPSPPSTETQAVTAAEPNSMSQSDNAPATGAEGKRAPGQENEPLMAWRAFGNEPFWQARVDGDDLYFSTPEDQEGRLMHGRRVPSLEIYRGSLSLLRCPDPKAWERVNYLRAVGTRKLQDA